MKIVELTLIVDKTMQDFSVNYHLACTDTERAETDSAAETFLKDFCSQNPKVDYKIEWDFYLRLTDREGKEDG